MRRGPLASLPPAPGREGGISLVELMVAMVVGLLLVAGIAQAFLSQRQTYRLQEALGRTQENGRYALDWIAREARMSGYLGCDRQAARKDALNANTLFQARWDRPIEGFNAADASSWNASIAEAGLTAGTGGGDEVRGGTDILVLRRGAEPGLPLAQAMTSASDGLRVVPRTPPPVQAGDLLVLSDCKRSTLFQATAYDATTGDIAHAIGTSPAPGNQTTSLSDAGPDFDRDAEVTPLQTVVLFVGTDGRGRPALRRKVGTAPSEVLASGVENMQVLYGLDVGTADGIANRYVPAQHVPSSAWPNVVTVRVAMLLQSEDELAGPADTRAYRLLDQEVSASGSITHAGDRRLRRVVSTTVNLRN